MEKIIAYNDDQDDLVTVTPSLEEMRRLAVLPDGTFVPEETVMRQILEKDVPEQKRAAAAVVQKADVVNKDFKNKKITLVNGVVKEVDKPALSKT